MEHLQAILDGITDEVMAMPRQGKVANYIPQLAEVDPDQFGFTVALPDGTICSAGDAQTPFSIQSISKVFTTTMALAKWGGVLWRRVGREPSGDRFNSIVQLEVENGIPRNPFINAGAIAVADTLMAGRGTDQTITEIVEFVRCLAGDAHISVDEKVAESEWRTGDRNASLAHFMASYGHFENPVDPVLDVYFRHCSIAMSCEQLARSALYLVTGGLNPTDGSRVISEHRAKRINSLMMMCGHYDGSGEFAFRVGLPGKSGVGGGIIAVAPGKASLAVWSPRLDPVGNSHLGSIALELLTQRTGWSVFGK